MVRVTFIAWVFILAGWSAVAAELRLREEATVAGGMVRLADVAVIADGDAAELGNVLLCPAPGAGKERIIRRGEINELLSLAEVETKQLRWSGAEQIVIRRASGTGVRHAMAKGNTKAGSTVEQSVQHALVSYLEMHQPGDVAWSVAPAIPSRYFSPLKEAERIEVAGGQAPFTGRQSFEIIAQVQGHERRIPIEAEVAALPRAIVALRPIAKGEVVRPEDVESRPLAADFAGSSERLLAREEVIGRETTRPLTPGQPITAADVQLPRLVHRGDKVTVRSLAAGISITTSGKAAQDGALGDSIPVELEDPKRQILATVAGPLLVQLGNRPPAPGALKAANDQPTGGLHEEK
ncbi:MAG TPA: flagellar basal body P-ring formation chaperone FlgA [Pirellulaceae bacterium]|nr:flagellar basal body P-ring formation chaperone FlgA [Pirellulaceae bacterium]